ncbi:MAG: hypothetical protein QOE54_327 [Streptosporangiaceae bacterium]|jgi:hypothetical protein|nr:hypothetical protein [Streptosporangiaceae bacterium]MDX6427961.1 hypothetical protein [Streptosporangiaceae bacterium]
MGSMIGVRPSPGQAADRQEASPSVLAMRIGVVAAEAAFATFARNIDIEEAAEGGFDVEGYIGPAEWPVFSLVLDTLSAAEPGDTRSLDERRADALRDLARICLAVKDSGT